MIDKLYYLLYKEIKTTRKNDQSFFNAYIGLSFLEYLNLGSVFGIVNHFSKYSISKDASIYGGVVILGFILLYNYFTLWINKEKIISKYSGLLNRNGKLLIWGTIIFSFVLFYIVIQYFVDAPH